MSRSEFLESLARVTGETPSSINRRGFSLLTRGPVEMEPDDYMPPQIVDWDDQTLQSRSALIDELI